MGSRLEEAELTHAKELEAINVKLFEEQKKNESVMLEMDNMQLRLSRAEEVEKHLEEMKAEEAKVEEQGNMVDTACDKEGKAGLGMAAPGVPAGISITGGGGRVQSPEVWFVCMGE